MKCPDQWLPRATNWFLVIFMISIDFCSSVKTMISNIRNHERSKKSSGKPPVPAERFRKIVGFRSRNTIPVSGGPLHHGSDRFFLETDKIGHRIRILYFCFHNLASGQSKYWWYKCADHRCITFQLSYVVMRKSEDPIIMENNKNGHYRPKSGILWFQKNHDAEWKFVGFFYQRS